MSVWKTLIQNLPEVRGPTQKKLSFKEKLKWTGMILLLFFILGYVPLVGLGQNALNQFEILAMILGAEFGSIISLGIGPIVTASIVLQLLNGSGMLKFDLTVADGKRTFQGVQKLLSVFFILFESSIYVLMGGLAPNPALQGTSAYFHWELFLIAQLAVGGILIMLMDEVVSKWGFGSGISLFIAAGVSKGLFLRTFSPLPAPNNPNLAVGAIPQLVQSLGIGDPQTAMLALAGILSTVLVFCVAVYAQSMKVELPLSFGKIRGHGIRWPLSFMYTSNIPVILVAALMANIQLWGRLLQNSGHALLGTFSGNQPISGLVAWINPPDLVGNIIRGSLTFTDIWQSGIYLIIFIAGCVLFGYFWVQTAGMDAKSQAKQITASGLQIPGFRQDQRVLERLLDRYIGPLSIMGAVAVGFLAALADLTGALTNGTGLLLTVMIVYRLYEEISKQHMMDMNPMMRRFME